MLNVLQHDNQIADARQRMTARGLSQLERPSRWRSLLNRLTGKRDPDVGDYVKSWDVLQSIEFLESKLAKDDPILDIGCWCSEIVVSLHDAGFTNLSGVDLNPDLQSMPHAKQIRYVQSDFMRTPFADGSFAAVTSISVIEHGYDGPRLLAEVGRLLRPGGYFVASFDYWPDKIDTAGTRFFDMDWLIFSKGDVEAMVAEAAKHGLRPPGDLNFAGGDRAIHHGGQHYTFGWLVLQKPA